MLIKIKLLLWYLLIQVLVLASFNYALFINVEHSLRENISGVIQTHEAIEHFLKTLWLLTPFIVILSSFGGYFLISRYFKQLKEMLSNIQTVSANDLSKRIVIEQGNDEITQLEEIKTLQTLMENLLFLSEYNMMQTQNELEHLNDHTRSLLELKRASCEIKG